MRHFALLTLLPLAGCLSVTVVTPNADRADVMSTAAPSGGPALGEGALIERFVVSASSPEPMRSRNVLLADREYVVVVEGTYSLWARAQWRRPCVGEPSDSASRPTGLDAAYAFAAPSGSTICDRDVPSVRSGWVYRLRPDDPWSDAPDVAVYNERHVYAYPVRGEGSRLSVLIREVGEYRDNYGELRVSIYRAVL